MAAAKNQTQSKAQSPAASGDAQPSQNPATSTQVERDKEVSTSASDPDKEKADARASLAASKAEDERQEREIQFANLKAELADVQGKLEASEAEKAKLQSKLDETTRELDASRGMLNKIRVGGLELPGGTAQLLESVPLIDTLIKARVDAKMGDVIICDGKREQVETLSKKYGKTHRVYAVTGASFRELVSKQLASPGA